MTTVPDRSGDLRILADYAAGLDAAALPPDVLEIARACLLYGLAIGIGTVHAKTPAAIATAIDAEGGSAGRATRLLDGARSTIGAAALANGVLLSGRVQGDSHPAGHIGGVVIPAALAAAEQRGASGRDFLSALVAGYEVALRIGRDHAADLSSRGFRTTPCYGVLGAAAVGARIHGLDGAAMAATLGMAANFASGLREYVSAGSDDSPFQAGFAARNGLTCANIVAGGFVSGAATALHGGAGLFRAYGKPDVDYGRRLVERLGEQFEFTTVTYKPYPTCQFARGVVRGIAALREQAGSVAAEAIELRMNPFEADFIGARHAGPYTSSAQTVMSMPFNAALAWTTGTASFAGLRDFEHAEVLDAVARTRVIADPSRARYQPHLRVILKDGRAIERAETGEGAFEVRWPAAVEMTHALLAEVGAPPSAADALIAICATAETLPDIGPIVAAVRDAVKGARAGG